MATLPIPGLLAEFKILGLQAMDFGAQLSHFRARVLHWGDQIREEMTGNTDLCQLAVHDHLGLTKIAPKGKGLVLLQPEQKNQKERDGQRFTDKFAQVIAARFLTADNAGRAHRRASGLIRSDVDGDCQEVPSHFPCIAAVLLIRRLTILVRVTRRLAKRCETYTLG